MENGKFTPKNEEKAMSRRAFLEKAGAFAGGAAVTYGGYEALINAPRKEKAEGKVVNKYRHLPRKVEINTLRAAINDESLSQGRRDYAARVIAEAAKRDEELRSVGSSGKSKAIGILSILGGAVLAAPHMLRRRQEILEK